MSAIRRLSVKTLSHCLLLLYASSRTFNFVSASNLLRENELRVGRKQVPHSFGELTDEQVVAYSQRSNSNLFRDIVSNLLVSRVVGSTGHKHVREYIIKTLTGLHWNVDVDTFDNVVPIKGNLTFHNIIATLNPNAERFLTIACHYDSKYFEDFEFLGATDSAVPCALMLNLAHAMQAEFRKLQESAKLSLMLLFFDGEEAFKKWGPNDSIYGARHLAKKWQSDGMLDRIDILMLLDLLGAPDPQFYSFFPNTESWYARLVAIEDRLSKARLLKKYMHSGVSKQSEANRLFQPNSLRHANIEDDHIPFIQRNVPCLHVIPVPFPTVWHTKDDNESIIDYVTSENIFLILQLFTMEYLMGEPENLKKLEFT